MPRKSLVHYISPSAISITPNCNESANDLAVSLIRGAKIKVFSPAVGLETEDGYFQEWTLYGRNRRLADSAGNDGHRYTIYARLPKANKDGGYLVFAQMTKDEDGEWVDKYWHVTSKGYSRRDDNRLDEDFDPDDPPQTDKDEKKAQKNNWWFRLGEVSEPSGGQRTVTLDTGILGTDQFNTEWNLVQEGLHVDLTCRLVEPYEPIPDLDPDDEEPEPEGEDAGPTPYVPWGYWLFMKAELAGVRDDEVVEVKKWEITRSTGAGSIDWMEEDDPRREQFKEKGRIDLKHTRGGEGTDDFGAAVSLVFTVTAWGTKHERTDKDDEEEEQEPVVVVQDGDEGEEGDDGEILAMATITIMSETNEQYALQLSETIVNYDEENGFSPEKVFVHVRSTDQRTAVMDITTEQMTTARLSVEYALANDLDTWIPLTFADSDPTDPDDPDYPNLVARAFIGGGGDDSVFYEGENIIVRLIETLQQKDEDGQTSTVIKELSRKTILNYYNLGTKYVTVGFFKKLFAVHHIGDDGNDEIIETNWKIKDEDEDPTVNIEAKRGFWSPSYVSALGQGSGEGGGGAALEWPLQDINVADMPRNPKAGDTIVWDGTTFSWGKSGADMKKLTLYNGSATLAEYDGKQAVQLDLAQHFVKTQGSSTITGDLLLIRTPGTAIGNTSVLTKQDAEKLFDERYVRVDWFKKVFETYRGTTKYDPNDPDVMAGTVMLDNLKVLVGTWTEHYVSALGTGSDGGSGGVWYLSQLDDVDHTKSPSNGDVLIWNGNKWTYGQAGIGTDELNTILAGKTLTIKDGTTQLGSEWNARDGGSIDISGLLTSKTWWGRTLNNGKVRGDIEDADNIYVNRGKGIYMQDSDGNKYNVFNISQPGNAYAGNELFVGYGLIKNSYTKYYNLNLYGSTIKHQHGVSAGNPNGYWTIFRDSGHVTINASDDTVSGRDLFLNVGGNTKTTRLYLYIDSSGDTTKDVYLEYDGGNKGVHIVNAGAYADTYVSALGLGSTGSGLALNDLLMSLNGTSLSPTSTGYTNAVLVNTNGSWSWKEYGGGTANLKTLTINSGNSLVATYDPAGNPNQSVSLNEGTGIKLTVTSNAIAFALDTVANLTTGTYRSVTVDSYGRVTAGTNPTTLDDYGILANDALFADITAGKASEIATTVKLWGNDFNGTQSIGYSQNGTDHPASLSYVRDITMSGNVKMNRGQFIQMKVGDDYRNVLGTDYTLDILSFGYRTAEQGLDTDIFGANTRLFYYDDTWREGLTLANDGCVGIGTSTPAYKLHVNGVSRFMNTIGQQSTVVTRGTAPTSRLVLGRGWYDKNNTPLGWMEFTSETNGDNYLSLFVLGNIASTTTNDYGGLRIKKSVNNTGNYAMVYDANTGQLSVTSLKIGNVVITNENSGIHVNSAGLYADTYVSSLGIGSDGTAVTGVDWEALSTYDGDSNHTIARQYMDLATLTINVGSNAYTYNGQGNVIVDIADIGSGYLPLTIPSAGKTVNMPGIGALTFKSSASDYPLLRFEGATSGGLGFIGIGKTGSTIEPYFVTTVNGVYNDSQSKWYKLIHSGNMSELFTTLANSGDNISVTVGGTNKTLTVGFATTASRLRNLTMASGDDYDTLSLYTPERGAFVATNWLTGSAFNSITLDGKGLYDTLVSFGYGNRTIQLKGSGWSDDLKYRHVYTQPNTSSTYILSPWKTIAFTDGTIAKADRLSSNDTKIAWGRTFWSSGQPQNISGNIENVDEIYMNRYHYIRIKDSESDYVNMLGMDNQNNFSVFWGALAKEYSSGIYGYNVYVGHGRSGSNPAYYTCFRNNGHVTINANDKEGYFLTVGGNSYANTVVGNRLSTDSTLGETVLLNTSMTRNCILFQIDSTNRWSMGTSSTNTFYWYTQPGGNQTVMSLTSEGLLTVKKLKIGSIVISEDTTNHAIHVEQNGMYADTFVSSLGTGSSGEGGGGADLSEMWTDMRTPSSDTDKRIDISHYQTSLDTYLSGKSYATLTNIKEYVKTISWSMDTNHTNQLKYTNGNNSSSYVTIAYATKAGSVDSTARLSQTTLDNGASIANFKHDTDLIYTAKGGGNGCQDKPVSTIDSFGLLSFKTASGYYGQILTATGGDMYYRTGSTLNGGWKRLLDSENWSTLVTSAPRLSGDTPYSAWGQTYWNNGQPQNISGEMSSVTSIDSLAYFYTSSRKQVRISSGAPTAAYTYKRDNVTYIPRLYVDDNLGVSNEVLAKGIDFIGESGESGNGGYLDFHYGASDADFTTRIIETANGVLTVKKSGTSASDITGLVIGNNRNGDYIKIGGATLTWVAGQGLKIDTGFWSESFVSSLGMGSGSSGGTDTMNTAGVNRSNSSLLYLVGSKTYGTTGASDYDITYTSTKCYIGSDNCLYSNGSKVLTEASGGLGTDTQDTTGIYQSANEKLFLIGSKDGPSQETNAHAKTYENSGCYIDTDNCLYSNSKKVLSAAGGSISNGHLYLEGAQASSATSNTTQIVFGTSSAFKVALSGISSALVINSTTSVGNNNTQIGTGSAKTYFNSTGDFIIGASSVPDNLGSPKVYVKANSCIDGYVAIGTAVNTSYKLKVSGNAYVSELKIGDNVRLYPTNVSTNADVLDISAAGLRLNGNSITSDMRKKDVVSMIGKDDLTFEAVARAPIFNFRWKQWPDGLTYVGTSAQYWQAVLPNAVLDLDDTLSLDYGATALAAAVMTARTVLTHEERIAALEAENKRLRTEIELLKAA